MITIVPEFLSDTDEYQAAIALKEKLISHYPDLEKSKEKDYLLLTDVAIDVADIIRGGPVPRHIKPIWPFISFTAFNTLPPEFKNIYGINETKFKFF